jgi:hypothetical protein
VAASFGIGLIAALYATHARLHDPVAALHVADLVRTAACLVGLLTALAPPHPAPTRHDPAPAALLTAGRVAAKIITLTGHEPSGQHKPTSSRTPIQRSLPRPARRRRMTRATMRTLAPASCIAACATAEVWLPASGP